MSGGACYLSCFCAVLSLLLLHPTSTGQLVFSCLKSANFVCSMVYAAASSLSVCVAHASVRSATHTHTVVPTSLWCGVLFVLRRSELLERCWL